MPSCMAGEAAGTYREYLIENADYTTVRFH